MIQNQQFRKKITRYGAALSTMCLAPHAEAAIVDLTPNLPGPFPFQATVSVTTSFDFVGGPANDLGQFNDNIGKTFFSLGDIAGIRFTSPGSPITSSKNFFSAQAIGASNNNTSTFGFLTTANQTGWIQINFGGLGGPVSYLAAALNDVPGGTINAGEFVGTNPIVPEPTSGALAGLGILALGALGVRRLRKRRVEDTPPTTEPATHAA